MVKLKTSRAKFAPIQGVRRSVSLRDVAALAGVSTGTVSRTMTRPELISAETRTRVMAAVEHLGYVSNGSARALVRRKSFTVGALVPRFGSAYFPSMVQALEATLAASGYKLLLSMPEHTRLQDPAMVRALLESGVDALALLGACHPPQTLSLLATHNIPVVAMWAAVKGPLPSIIFDEHEAAALVVGHLVDLDHRRVGFIGGYVANNERAEQRLLGIGAALKKRRLALESHAYVETGYGFAEGYAATVQLLHQMPDVTAIICGNDYLAAGALSALRNIGIIVPQQMSVISFNDNDFSAYLTPALTTVHIPMHEIGAEAGRFLLAKLRGEKMDAPSRLQQYLTVRQSTAPAPQLPHRKKARR